MLTASEIAAVHSLLSRFNSIPEGETVVANLLRSLEGGIVAKPLAEIVLKAWCDLVRDADAASLAHGHGAVSAESALRLTESELVSTVKPSPLWTAIRTGPVNPFTSGPTGTGPVSNLKSLATVMQHLLGIYDLPDPHSGAPIPISHHVTTAMRKRQTGRIRRALSAFKSHPVVLGARIHHRRWFWVTTSRGLAEALSGCINDQAAAKAVDMLGLVHFSRKQATQSPTDRYVVEVKLAASFGPECVKPSFIFADHNPRFVAWTDPVARADPHWGRAADLAIYHNHVRLEHGCKEMVRATPTDVTPSDIVDLVVLGYLDVNRWGLGDVADGTEVFADRLRHGRSKADMVDSVVSFLG